GVGRRVGGGVARGDCVGCAARCEISGCGSAGGGHSHRGGGGRPGDPAPGRQGPAKNYDLGTRPNRPRQLRAVVALTLLVAEGKILEQDRVPAVACRYRVGFAIRLLRASSGGELLAEGDGLLWPTGPCGHAIGSEDSRMPAV